MLVSRDRTHTRLGDESILIISVRSRFTDNKDVVYRIGQEEEIGCVQMHPTDQSDQL